jgi:hypothetical protein
MTRTKLLSILQEETDGFKEQSRLRDDVLDAMEQAYIKGKKEQLTIPVVVQQSEQLFCGVKGGFCPYEESDRKCRAEHKCINQVAK